MLNATEEIRECYREAIICSREAEAQTDPQKREHFWELNRRWLLLALSYETGFPARDLQDSGSAG
jgi:hypothetical protein